MHVTGHESNGENNALRCGKPGIGPFTGRLLATLCLMMGFTSSPVRAADNPESSPTSVNLSAESPESNPSESTPENLAIPRSSTPGPAREWSADLPAVSDGRHLWLWVADTQPTSAGSADEPAPVHPDAPPVTALYHADLRETAPDGPNWESVARISGRLAPGGVAASEDRLHLIFDSGHIQVLTLRPGRLPGNWFYSTETDRSLPQDTVFRAAAAAHGQLWVLVRVDSPEALQALDQANAQPLRQRESAVRSPQDIRRRNLILGLPLSTDLPAPPPHAPPPSGSTANPGADDQPGAGRRKVRTY